MDTPLISVILATYNGSRFLSEALESVILQEYQNIEILIINDASTDEKVAEIINTYVQRDHRIISFQNEKNMERSWSKNFGVSHAKGDFVAFIDDDDIWNPMKLSQQIEQLLSDKNIGIVGTFARFIDESGKLLSETSHLKTNSEDIKQNILLSNQFIHSSVLIRKDVFSSVGGFPESIHLCEDYDLWLRILQKTQGKNIPLSLVNYRVRGSSTTAKNIYRMKYYSLLFTWKYRKSFPNSFRALCMRILLFPLNTLFLMKLWNIVFGKKS